MNEKSPTHEVILIEIKALRDENRDLRNEIKDIKKSAEQFDRLHSIGRTIVMFCVGLGALALFVLEVLRSIKHLMH